MSPLESNLLIWSHDRIFYPWEHAAAGNFHHLRAATGKKPPPSAFRRGTKNEGMDEGCHHFTLHPCTLRSLFLLSLFGQAAWETGQMSL